MTNATERIVQGCAALAGLYAPVSEETAHDALATAWDGGVRSFDTAPHYGAGLSEERVGRFLATKPRDEFQLSTKVGRLLIDDESVPDGQDLFFDVPRRRRVFDFSADGIKRSLEASLTRLGLDRIDYVLLHDPEDHLDTAVREAVPVLREWREQKVIGGFGVGTNFAQVATTLVSEVDLDRVLIAGRYSLLDRRAESGLLELCADRGVEVQVAGVLNSGLLADPVAAATFNYEPAPAELILAAKRMQDVCRERGVELRAAALQFPLRHRAVGSVLIGAGRADLVDDCLTQLREPIDDQLWADLDRLVPDQDQLP